MGAIASRVLASCDALHSWLPMRSLRFRFVRSSEPPLWRWLACPTRYGGRDWRPMPVGLVSLDVSRVLPRSVVVSGFHNVKETHSAFATLPRVPRAFAFWGGAPWVPCFRILGELWLTVSTLPWVQGPFGLVRGAATAPDRGRRGVGQGIASPTLPGALRTAYAGWCGAWFARRRRHSAQGQDPERRPFCGPGPPDRAGARSARQQGRFPRLR